MENKQTQVSTAQTANKVLIPLSKLTPGTPYWFIQKMYDESVIGRMSDELDALFKKHKEQRSHAKEAADKYNYFMDNYDAFKSYDQECLEASLFWHMSCCDDLVFDTEKSIRALKKKMLGKILHMKIKSGVNYDLKEQILKDAVVTFDVANIGDDWNSIINHKTKMTHEIAENLLSKIKLIC